MAATTKGIARRVNVLRWSGCALIGPPLRRVGLIPEVRWSFQIVIDRHLEQFRNA
jgi:hypothetical protein